MSKQYPGGIVSKTAVTPSGPYETSTASGIWTLDQQMAYAKQDNWPTAGRLPPDPQFNYVTMLLHGDGTNGAQNNTFLDSSTNNFTITRNGNTTQGSFSPYGSNWSNYFDGAGPYFSLPSSSQFNLNGTFTAECWINIADLSVNRGIWFNGTFGSDANRIQLVVRTTGSIDIYSANGGSVDYSVTSTSGVIAVGVWYHVAVVKNGSALNIYVNGTSVASGSSGGGSAAFNDFYIGYARAGGASVYMQGSVSNFRLVNGTAVYTSSFTPSTTPLTAISGTALLTCQSNRFIDNSTNAFALTVNNSISIQRFNPFGASTAYSTSVIGGSGYFDGAGDKLTTPSSSAFDFGTGDFTIAMWAYANATIPTYSNAFFLVDSRTNANWYAFLASNKLYFGDSSGTEYNGGTIVPFTWNYLVISRVSGTTKGFVNGVEAFSFSDSGNYAGSPIITIGGRYTLTAYDLNGYISDVRILKGTGVTSVTVPTAPLTAITNTSLLLNYTNGAIFDNAMMNDLETVGNAQISTSVVKYGTGSMYFDGTGDYLSILNTPVSTPSGTESWTIEGWVYRTTSGAFQAIYVNGYPIQIYLNINTIEIYISSTNGFSYIVNGLTGPLASIALNTWAHFAVVRNGSNFTVYVNGVGGITVSSSTAIAFPSNANATIGDAPLFGAYGYTGYIDDLRITKGYARYTANFTPPTAAFPNIGPT